MTTLIILIVLVAISFYLATTWDYEALGLLMCVVFGLGLIIHSMEYFTAIYSYERFVEERSAFEQTLNEARKNGNKYEAATIIREVAEWNQKLAKYKYDNKTIFLDQYIDDRVELLEPIK